VIHAFSITTTIMKTFVLISRVLLGLMFLIFGLNGFLNFIPAPPPTGIAGQFIGAMFVSHYLAAVFALEIVAGVLLLANRFVPAALTILAPLLVNIVFFHVFMAPANFAPAVMAIVLWAILFARERSVFLPLLAAKGTS
jgi:putative oxidoreductase